MSRIVFSQSFAGPGKSVNDLLTLRVGKRDRCAGHRGQRAFGFPDTLHDDLFGGLGRDASEFGILDLLLDEVADLGAFLLIDGVHQTDHAVRRFHHHIIGDHFPAAEAFVSAVFRIDGNADRHVFVVVALLGGGRQSLLHRLHDDLAVNAFFFFFPFHDRLK